MANYQNNYDNYNNYNNYDTNNYNNYHNSCDYGCNTFDNTAGIATANLDSNCQPNSDYTVDLRTELIIKESPQSICNVLQELCRQNVNIDGYSLQALCDQCSVFRFVPGSDDCQQLTDLQVAQSILSNLNIEYLDDAIFKVTPRSRANSDVNLANLYCALQRNVTVNAAYPATSTGFYFQANPIDEALNTLKISNFC